MGFKLGDISPVAGAISGKGLFGKGLSELGRTLGPLSPVGYFAMKQRDKAEEEDAKKAAEKLTASKTADAPQGAKRGGAVKKKPMANKKMAKGGSASRRADGCATKGKTKGRFV